MTKMYKKFQKAQLQLIKETFIPELKKCNAIGFEVREYVFINYGGYIHYTIYEYFLQELRYNDGSGSAVGYGDPLGIRKNGEGFYDEFDITKSIILESSDCKGLTDTTRL